MKKFKEATIHIGLHKTGTTFIQNCLFMQRHWLSKHADVCYPDFAENHSVWMYSLFCSDPSTYHGNWQFGSPEELHEANEKRIVALQKILEEATESRLLISGEGLSLLTAAEVLRFRQWIDRIAEKVSVLVFLREPFAWATSMVQQLTKAGKTLDQIYENPPSLERMCASVQSWHSVFGASAITVVDYDRAKQHPKGIIGAFCVAASLPEAFADQIQVRKILNESMSSVAVCLMDAWNKTNAKAGVLGRKEKRLGQAVALFRTIEGEKFRLPHSTLKQVADSSAHGRNWLHANLGIEYSLEWPTVPDQGPVILDEVSASSIASLLLNLQSGISGYDRVVAERDRAKQEIKALRMRLGELKDERKLAKQRCQAVEKQVSQWNARSWITRAFHKLRLVK